ncbi:MAG: NAD(P)H-binding protein [Hyphomicrobiales bacterium]
MTSLLVLGATGVVGREALRLALADARVTRVVAPTRRVLAIDHPKLENPVVDFDALPTDAAWWGCDGAICALGTTMKKAGSREAFRRVDFDAVLESAQALRRQGCRAFALVTAAGSKARSPVFYSRVKGEIEQAVRDLGFASLTIARPSFIGGEREERRPAERAFLALLRTLDPVLPRAMKMNPAPVIAAALLEAVLAAQPGVRVIRSAALAG